ncbi:nucleoside hydrolase [Catenuloplanes atrovinosus]|uniref:Inosine-uridine nucleoside N-ribohydrolase n=1 Tax=Catenuloplanes atrovinosus TaxID=137266 RepID=A0AAE3YMT1_9ACTN|nr:nucleoside hydrolase [Catenuloplanes atrovinosus]MDR7275372.1 inosine-uridine nucleoside N-ribohydrolase [Catenuloplanes atrovinosus]
MRRLLSVPLMLLLLLVSGFTAVRHPLAVIYDSDLDFDDASTLAMLCEQDRRGRISLRAVTVAENGFGLPGRALTHARSILDECGLPGVPIAAGAAGRGVHPAPAELVTAIETVLTDALGDAGHGVPDTRETAPELIARTARSSPDGVVVLATGALTNVADALADPRVARRVDAVRVMGGALEVGGNLFGSALPGFDNSQEFNMWLDPVSAALVLDRARVDLVPLDATRFVPITTDFVARLGAQRSAPAADITYRIVSHPILAALIAQDVMYWWDALAAVSLLHPAVITAEARVRVTVVQDGPQSGRTVTGPHGSRVRAALAADGPRFEELFLRALNGA